MLGQPRARPRRRRASAGPLGAAFLAERAVEVVGRRDQPEVRERLREVAERLAARADLLRVEPEVVGVAEHLLEHEARLVQLARAREALDVPEAAERERPLAAGQAVVGGLLGVVAEHEAVAHELVADRVQRREHARVARRDHQDEREDQHARVEHVAVGVLVEGLARLRPAVRHDPLVGGVAGIAPGARVGRQSALGLDADRAVERDPGHDPRVGEVAPAAAHLPDALVGLIPVLGEPVEDRAQLDPERVRERHAPALGEVDGVDDLAVDVQLELVRRAVADAHGPRVAVAGEVRELDLVEVAAPVERVHDLERRAVGDACSRARAASSGRRTPRRGSRGAGTRTS